MDYDFHTTFGVIAAFLGMLSFVPYIRDVLRGSTKPHPFTWLIWALIAALGFSAQLSAGGGAGAWITGLTALECLTIAGFAFLRGERRIVAVDWLCFIAASAGFVLWAVTRNPLSAILLIMVVNGLAAIPTLRKSYLRPYEETVATYAIGSAGFFFALLGLETFNFTTALLPASISLSNALLVTMLLIRRRQLGRRRR